MRQRSSSDSRLKMPKKGKPASAYARKDGRVWSCHASDELEHCRINQLDVDERGVRHVPDAQIVSILDDALLDQTTSSYCQG